jgi:ribonuclease P protein component
VGIVVPKYNHTGVERNRVKRRLRELSRTRVLPALAAAPADLVIRALPAAYQAQLARLSGDLDRVIGQILGARGTKERPNERSDGTEGSAS